MTDEPPTDTFDCPVTTAVVNAATAIGARIVGIKGDSGADSQLTTDLSALAVGTGAVDSFGAPLVVSGIGAQAASAIQELLLDLVADVPLSLTLELTDDPNDGVDAVESFVERVETLQLGTSECSDGLADEDTDFDGNPDTFLGVLPQTPVCWQVVLKENDLVPAGGEPQVYPATLRILAEGVTELVSRTITFVVPALP